MKDSVKFETLHPGDIFFVGGHYYIKSTSDNMMISDVEKLTQSGASSEMITLYKTMAEMYELSFHFNSVDVETGELLYFPGYKLVINATDKKRDLLQILRKRNSRL